MPQIKVKIIADSLSVDGSRLTSFQLQYHRYIHGELLTHRAFSRSCSSSRAMPIKRVLGQVWSDPAIPVKWGGAQSGMQSGVELKGWRKRLARRLWSSAGKVACVFSWSLMKLGLHKEVANRLLEPWQLMNVILTATDFDNFFALRFHEDAQPEIQVLAARMNKAMLESEPRQLQEGEWHLPYVRQEEIDRYTGTDNEWLLPALSTARCARVSYNTHSGTKPTVEADLRLFEMLVISRPAHSSPAEHQAIVDSNKFRSRNFQGGWSQFREILELDGWSPYAATGDSSETK